MCREGVDHRQSGGVRARRVDDGPGTRDEPRENLGRQDAAWASIRPAEPDVLGIPPEAPFDRILVSATARKVPDELVGQLADDGVMVVPVGSAMTRVRRTGPDLGDVDITTHGSYSFVPLR